MKKLIFLPLLALLAAGYGFAQTRVIGNEADKIVRGVTLPNLCQIGDVFYLTAGATGQYICPVTDTWTKITAIGELPVGTANQYLKTNAGATSLEHVTLGVGTTGTDFAIAHAANSTTFNLPDASATARGVVTTAAQTIAGDKTFSGVLAVPDASGFRATATDVSVGTTMSRVRFFSNVTDARINVGTQTAGAVGMIIHGTGTQTGDLLQLRDSDETTVLSRFTAAGAVQLPQQTVTFSATPTFNASLGNSFKITLTGNVTSSTISNPQTGESIALLLCQDATGSRTMTWPTNWLFPSASGTLSVAANACDNFSATYDGTNWIAEDGDASATARGVITTGTQTFAGAKTFTGNILLHDLNKVRYADQFAGADAGAKIIAAIADLPSTGGTVDARGLEGAQTISSDMFAGVTKLIKLLLGAATFTVTATQKPDSDVTIMGSGGGITKFVSNLTTPIFQSSNTAARKYRWLFKDFGINNTTRNNAGGIGIDLTNVGSSQYHNLIITNVETCIKFSSSAGQQSSWNELYSTVIVGTVTGALIEDNGGATNEMTFVGGSISDGTNLVDVTASQPNLKMYGVGMETWTNRAIRLGSTTTGVTVVGGRGEQTGGTFLEVGSDGQSILVANVLLNGVTTVLTGGILTNANPKLTLVEQNGAIATGLSVGIGSYNQTAGLVFNGNAARTFQVERHTTTNTAGSALTVRSGGATVGATDKDAGALLLSSGTATGDGGGEVRFLAVTPSQGAGTTDRAPAVKMTLSGGGNLTPTVTGQDLGASGTRWDIFGQAVDFTSGLIAANDASITPQFKITQASTGDAAINFLAGANWTIGSDNSDSDQFKITGSNELGVAGEDQIVINRATDTVQIPGTLSISKAIFSTMTTVTFSATPTFDVSLGNSFKMTLTGNVTSSTLSNAQTGQHIWFEIIQDGTGGRTFAWPSNVVGGVEIDKVASATTTQEFIYDGTNAIAVSRGTEDGYTLQFGASTFSPDPPDATTYYIGDWFFYTPDSTAGRRRIYFPRAGTVKSVRVKFVNTAPGTAETSTIYFRLNDTTDTVISSAVTNDAAVTTFVLTGAAIAVTATDYFEIKWVTPTWVTNPTGVVLSGSVYVE